MIPSNFSSRDPVFVINTASSNLFFAKRARTASIVSFPPRNRNLDVSPLFSYYIDAQNLPCLNHRFLDYLMSEPPRYPIFSQ